MTKKRYKVETSCPQCGCSAVSHLSTEEIRERYGDVPNVLLEGRRLTTAREADKLYKTYSSLVAEVGKQKRQADKEAAK